MVCGRTRETITTLAAVAVIVATTAMVTFPPSQSLLLGNKHLEPSRPMRERMLVILLRTLLPREWAVCLLDCPHHLLVPWAAHLLVFPLVSVH